MTTKLICGVDEAGRGPLAGPVYAAAVILDGGRPIDDLADSKALSASARARIARQIRKQAQAWAIARATVAEIDALNILQASLLAMRRAVEALRIVPNEVWVDGNRCPLLACPTKAVIGGDASVAEISAASILAKVARDAEMMRLHKRFPQYGFDKHKGYPTEQHLSALRRHGVCPVHRRSFAPVRARVSQFVLELI